MENVRLQKYMADCGICSRRKAEELILQGKIKVNGKVVQELGSKVNPEKDTVMYNDRKITLEENKVYILLNKPIGYVTTVKEQFGRDKVTDLIKGVKERLIPAGRLDMYTSGALILSNDGEFINKLTHPKNEIEKTYNVTIAGVVNNEDCEKLKEKHLSRIQITIHEGKNREIRKMCEAIGKKVLALHRSKIGSIDVKDLKIGRWRYLTKEEIKRLLNR